MLLRRIKDLILRMFREDISAMAWVEIIAIVGPLAFVGYALSDGEWALASIGAVAAGVFVALDVWLYRRIRWSRWKPLHDDLEDDLNDR